MRKYYQNDAHNVAFERCVEVIATLIVKYGPKVLAENGDQQVSCVEGEIPDAGKPAYILLCLQLCTTYFVQMLTFARKTDIMEVKP